MCADQIKKLPQIYEQQNKGDKMRKQTVIDREPKQSFLPIIGGIMIAFAVADFALSYAGVNLTSFLGPASRFSPIVLGLIGGALLNSKE